jgi:hypothetical protein
MTCKHAANSHSAAAQQGCDASKLARARESNDLGRAALYSLHFGRPSVVMVFTSRPAPGRLVCGDERERNPPPGVGGVRRSASRLPETWDNFDCFILFFAGAGWHKVMVEL